MKTALLVIDFIRGIAESGSCAGYLNAHPEVISNTNILIKQAREQAMPIYHIRLDFDADYTDLPKHAPVAEKMRANQAFQLGTDSTEFIDAIDIAPEDHLIEKKYGDPFHGNDLLQQLKQQDIEGVIFTGIATENAILNGANTAMCNDLHVTIISDACGGTSAEAHQNALNFMQGRTATRICTTNAL